MGESGKIKSGSLQTALVRKAPLPPLRRSPFPVGEGQEPHLLPLFNIEMRHSTYCPPSRSGKSWLSFGWMYHST